VHRAVTGFIAGDPVLVFDADDREGETDIVCPASAITSSDVTHLRNDAGGLVCVAVDDVVAEAFDLPFLDEIIDHQSANHDPAYDERSSFSLPVNHRDTFTGVTDNDRARTITRLATAAATPETFDFAAEFRTPGHVHLLRAAKGLSNERRGHTEIGIALTRAAGIAPAVVVCEMLDDETGSSLSPKDAHEYAARHGLQFVTGREIVGHLDGR
jgi:3,4-dihydroxy 2-butanone 4-phosphate synthase